ncbi:hypothetical protein KH5_19980 [Urechidicola sp. KH5]
MNKPLIKIFAISGCIAAILGIIFSFLPLFELAIFPASLGLILGLLAHFFAKRIDVHYRFSRFVIGISLIAIIVSSGKQLLIDNEVEDDIEFQQKEEQSEEDAVKDLEELDELEDLE